MPYLTVSELEFRKLQEQIEAIRNQINECDFELECVDIETAKQPREGFGGHPNNTLKQLRRDSNTIEARRVELRKRLAAKELARTFLGIK